MDFTDIRCRFIKNSDISEKERDMIIQLKSQFWKYDYSSQVAWLQNCLSAEALHLLLYEKDNLISYMSLQDVYVDFDGGLPKMAAGGGAVITDAGKRRLGYGALLMRTAQNYIMKNDRIGLVFCNDSVLNFYLKTGWSKAICDDIFIADDMRAEENLLLFNTNLRQYKCIRVEKRF